LLQVFVNIAFIHVYHHVRVKVFRKKSQRKVVPKALDPSREEEDEERRVSPVVLDDDGDGGGGGGGSEDGGGLTGASSKYQHKKAKKHAKKQAKVGGAWPRGGTLGGVRGVEHGGAPRWLVVAACCY